MPGSGDIRKTRTLAGILFACFFAAQSGYLVLTPVLTNVAATFQVSTATAGQLRTIGAAAAVGTAIVVGTAGRRLPRRTLLFAALALVAAGASTSAAAPSLAVLAAGQCLIGAASATVVAAGIAAAAEWSSEPDRGRVVAWAIVGAPAAWVATMPVIGATAAIAWRLAFLVPVAAAAAAALMLLRAPGGAPPIDRRAGGTGLRDRALRRWSLGEVLFSSAWGGTLAYAGALLVDSYGTSPSSVGIALGAGAAAYIPGTFAARKLAVAPRPLLGATGLLLAATVAGFGTARTGAVTSAAVFAVLCFLAGARSFLGSTAGLELATNRNVAMSVRAAAQQGGWIVGAAAGGAALAAGGYPALAAVLAALFAASTVPYAADLAAAALPGDRVHVPLARGSVHAERVVLAAREH